PPADRPAPARAPAAAAPPIPPPGPPPPPPAPPPPAPPVPPAPAADRRGGPASSHERRFRDDPALDEADSRRCLRRLLDLGHRTHRRQRHGQVELPRREEPVERVDERGPDVARGHEEHSPRPGGP